jgi:hypothetical protein
MTDNDKFIEPSPAKIVERVKEKGVKTAADTAGNLTEAGVKLTKNKVENFVKNNSAISSVTGGAGSVLSAVIGAASAVKGAYKGVKNDLPPEAQKALSEVEGYAEQKAKEKAEEEKKALQEFVEQKVSSVIQETGLGPEDSEKIIALVKDGCPSEDAKAMAEDATKKALT